MSFYCAVLHIRYYYFYYYYTTTTTTTTTTKPLETFISTRTQVATPLHTMTGEELFVGTPEGLESDWAVAHILFTFLLDLVFGATRTKLVDTLLGLLFSFSVFVIRTVRVWPALGTFLGTARDYGELEGQVLGH